ncbi:uncharacterized protein si:dkey-79d12.4 isoform X1 [Esox lucius]|uniref:C2H2-type domain-containing protein n=1 Tax=Esox lucius TaxID=8010 RepID=A0A3P9AHM6_ESOLU|nr:uncharacterized protein si:dkey-79d12.4 isoform X1 [Esox lucius]
MAAEGLMQETVGAEVELLEDVNNAYKQSPMDIPRFSVPLPFSMPDDSSDDDCDLPENSVSAYGMHSMELGGKCWECGVQFKSSQELIDHFESHRDKVSTSCNICQVTFSRTISLAMHLVNAHQNSVLLCLSCQQHFRNLWELNKHVGMHLFNKLFNSTLEDISNNSSNGGDEILKRCYSLPSAVALDHDYNSNDSLNDSEVTIKEQYPLKSSVAMEQEVKSNGGLNNSEDILNEHYTLPSTVAIKHEDMTNNGLNFSEKIVNRQFTLPSAVALDHDYNSNYSLKCGEASLSKGPCTLSPAVSLKREEDSTNGLNNSEETLNGHNFLPSAVGLDHTYSIESNMSSSKTRLRHEESDEKEEPEEQKEDIKPDPSTLTPSPRVQVKPERELELDGAPLQWDEWMSDGEGDQSENAESAGESGSDCLTETSGGKENVGNGSGLIEEKEMRTEYAGKTNVTRSEKQDTDAETTNDEDSDPSWSEQDSEFDPDELSDSGSGESSGSSYSPVRTRNAKMRPPRTKLPQSKLPLVKPYCIFCATGPYHDMDFHLRGCRLNGLTCTECSLIFQNRKALQNHKVLVHGKSPTMCAVCGRGPFINIDFHFRSCSRDWLFQCSECKVPLPSEKSLTDHNVRYHSAPSKPSDGICVFCGGGPFTSLDLHMSTCSKQKGLQCSVCQVFFPTELVLAEHMVSYHSTPSQVQSTNSDTSDGKGTCVHCGRGPFTSLDIHLRTCSKKKCIQCSLCKLFFPCDVLADHMISHHSTKSKVQSPVTETPDQNTCSRCGMGPFNNLDNHMRTCSQKKCIQCSVCKLFFSGDVLADHMISYHSTKSQSPVAESPDKGVCVHCGRGPFTSLEHHMRYCNKQNSIQCSMCKASFLTEGRLVNHIVSTHTDKLVTQPVGSPVPALPYVPKAISTTLGQQSPCSPTLMCYSSGVKELKQLAPVPVAGQGPSAVGQLTPTALSTVSLPRIMLSTTSSSPLFPNPAVPVMATLVLDNNCGGPGKIARLVPMVQQMNPPQLQVIAATQTNTAKALGQFFNYLQEDFRQTKSVQQQLALPTAPSTDLIRSSITPSPRPVSVVAPGLITAIRLSPFPTLPPGQTLATAVPPAPAPLSIMYMFVNRSRELALEKRMMMSWRSKGVYTCRQCGVVSRQPSLSVKHRYLHRGSRQYRCHCGRSFLRRMHLLRHYLLHAQDTRYICTACGETFDGARGLTQHLIVTSKTTNCSGDGRTLQTKKECRMPFTCHCGQVFCRPAAFLWHKLKSTQRT